MTQTVEEAIDLLIKKIQNISQKSLKSKSKVQKPRKKQMIPALLNSIETKNKLYKEWDKDRTNELNKNEFFTYEKILKSLIRDAKNRY